MPIIDLEGKRFFVDIRMEEMRQVDDFMNRINFYELWHDKTEKGLGLLFDHRSNTPYNAPWDDPLPSLVSRLELPNVQEWMTPATQEYYASERDFHRQQQLPEVIYAKVLQSGLKPVQPEQSDLPTVLLDGAPFYVDRDKQQLREAANPSNRIAFKHLNKEGEHYTLAYDRMYKTVYGVKNRNPHIHVVDVALDKDLIGEIRLKPRQNREISEQPRKTKGPKRCRHGKKWKRY